MRELEYRDRSNRISISTMFQVKRVLFCENTKYQQLDIIEVEKLGRCLFIDGFIQSSESDEFIYHQAMVHPAMELHSNPEKILICGGGEGATLREVLKYQIDFVWVVDIDKKVL